MGPDHPADDLQRTYRHQGTCKRQGPDRPESSLGRPKWVLLVLRRPKGVLRRPKGVLRRPKRVLRRPKGVLRRPRGVLIVQSRPQWVLEDDQQDVAQGSALLSLGRLGDDLLTRLSVPRTIHLARGVKLPPARGVGSLAIRLTRTHRPRIANNGTTNNTKTIIFTLPRSIFF